MSDTGGLIVKLLITAIALKMFIFPEPASTMTGLVLIAGVWGISLGNVGGGDESN